MAYYLKINILSGHNASYVEAREIEFYNDSNKISLSDLSVIYTSTEYGGSWCATCLIDGNVSDNTGWCNAGGVFPCQLIFKSNQPFSTIKVYNDSQNGYPIKELDFYVLSCSDIPTLNDSRWGSPRISRRVSLGNAYPNSQTIQIETFIIRKFLIQDGNNIENPITGGTYTVADTMPIKLSSFNSCEFENIKHVNTSLINKIVNNTYKIALYKK